MEDRPGSNPPEQTWYLETGQGMGATLTIGFREERLHPHRPRHLPGQQGQPPARDPGRKVTALLNVYHVITVNPDKWPKVNYEGAMAFAKFMTCCRTQEVIAEFGVDKYGQPLFYPDADKTDADLGLSKVPRRCWHCGRHGASGHNLSTLILMPEVFPSPCSRWKSRRWPP